MNNQEWAKDIKPFEWEELDGKTLRIRAGKHEGVMIVVGYDQETKDTFVLHEEFSAVPTIKPGDKEIWEAVKIKEVGQFIQTLIANGHYNIKTGRSTDTGYRLVVWTESALEVVE